MKETSGFICISLVFLARPLFPDRPVPNAGWNSCFSFASTSCAWPRPSLLLRCSLRTIAQNCEFPGKSDTFICELIFKHRSLHPLLPQGWACGLGRRTPSNRSQRRPPRSLERRPLDTAVTPERCRVSQGDPELGLQLRSCLFHFLSNQRGVVPALSSRVDAVMQCPSV